MTQNNMIIYHIDGDMLISQYSSESDTELIVPSKPHFIFHGWYDNDKYSGEEIRILQAGSQDVKVFFGYYEAIVYILTLDVNGGEQLMDNTFEMTFSESTYVLPVPMRIDYEFLGWFSASEGGTAYTDSNGKSYKAWREDGDRTFYAHWKAKYQVTLEPNGGTLNNKIINVKYNQIYVLPIPYRKGYKFLGWYSANINGKAYTDFEGNGLEIWKELGNTTLYAHWEVKEYEVKLNINHSTNDI